MTADQSTVVFILLSGVSLSTVGYALMLLTTALFPAWRRRRVNQLWLHMCGAKLLFVYIQASYDLWVFHILDLPWLDTAIGQKLHTSSSRYIFLASCSWVAAGAWLAYRQLVTAAPDAVHPHYIKRAALFAYLSPLPVCVTITLVKEYFPGSFNFTSTMVNAFVSLTVVSSLCLYARALCAVCYSGRAVGRRPDLLATTVLAVMFALTSGLQYAILIANHYITYILIKQRRSHSYNIRTVYNAVIISRKLHTIILYWNVALYSILLIACVKQTRQLWVQFIRSKLRSCLPRNREGTEITSAHRNDICTHI